MIETEIKIMTQYIIIFFTLFYTSISYSATVYKVSIKGNRLVETSIIKSHIQLNKGSVYSSKKVQKDVKKLFSLGFFDDIKVYSSYDKKNRLHLLYDFKERIFISEIQFKGNKSITLEELKKLSFINEYSFLNYDNLKKSISVITEKYKEKAYYLAELSYIFKKDTNKPSHTLIIEIKERSKLLVQKINFIGNRNISSHTLKSFLLTKEKNILSFLGSSGVYQSKNIDRDLQAIQYYYRDKGYLNVQVQDPEISISSDKRFLSVTFSISEGLRFKMGKQFFEGDDVVSASELKNRFKLEKKDYFSLSALQEDMQMIALLYKNKGYAFVEVQPLFFPDQLEEDKINVSFKVDKGLTYKIRRTHIKGNSDTRDKVIFKRFQIVEGDLFNQSKVDLTRQLLQQLPYLEKVDIQSQIYSPGQLDLLTEITERENTGEASLAGGYNSQTRLFIQAGIKKQNFLGLDQSIALNVTLSKYQENFIFSYKNPYFLDSNWNFGIDLFNTGQDSFTGSGNSSLFSAFSNDYLTYFRKDTGFSFSVGRHLTNFSTLFLKYKFNDLKLSNKRIYYLRDLPVFSTVFDFLFGSGEEDKDPALETEETVFKTPFENNLVQKSDLVNMRFSDIYDLEGNSGLNSSISAIWEYDKRNDRYYPSSGFFTRFSIEYSGLGGLFEWTKIQGELRHYYKPLWKLVVKNRLNTGAVFSNDKNKKVPFTELFLLGGPYDLRGFSVRSQGPKARSQEAYEYALKFNEISEDKINPDTFALRPYGGEQKFLYSLELEVPIVEKAGLRGAMFFDLGESNDRLSFDLQDQLRANIGFGVRWRSPFGPISLDWALPYKPRKEFQEKTWEFHFSMGSSL